MSTGNARPTEGAGALGRLLQAASSGEEAAWSELVGLYGRRVFALVRSRCGQAELAEEITQSVFVTLAEKLRDGDYVERGRFESWLFRIAVNRVRDEIRRQRRQARPTDPSEFHREQAREPAVGLEVEQSRRLRAAMDALPENDREVVELRHHGQMSFKDMADLLDEPVGTLLARHHRALRKMKDWLGQQADHDAREGS